MQKAFNYSFSAWVSLYCKKNILCEIGDYSVSKDLLIVGRGSMVRMHKWTSQQQIHKSRCLNSASLWKHNGVYVLSFYAILTPTDGSYAFSQLAVYLSWLFRGYKAVVKARPGFIMHSLKKQS